VQRKNEERHALAITCIKEEGQIVQPCAIVVVDRLQILFTIL
jgi:hypothetical protein